MGGDGGEGEGGAADATTAIGASAQLCSTVWLICISSLHPAEAATIT